jgi:hypothetical protein
MRVVIGRIAQALRARTLEPFLRPDDFPLAHHRLSVAPVIGLGPLLDLVSSARRGRAILSSQSLAQNPRRPISEPRQPSCCWHMVHG